ncbi:enoyl-CoA hydratase/isomerase family protein [Bacillus sp. FJAT-45350]|uniref:enoyl-CoA hydratase/isomerase family protein n=1 Tax=Bacillus sp. FJAT-45350 TaxID=2011014 RepID=UPI000BB8E614|nr:enoyl-CoA hydratase/isomerase family protein [Bacillus sp. FJAT-45350]
MGKVELTRESGIAWVTLNRPDKRNAIDFEVMELLHQVLTEVEENDDDKILVIRGAGDQAFCSGGDLSIFHNLHTKEQAQEMLSKMGEVLFRLFFFPKPTVAVINGSAVGGGCEIASACDFRIAAPHVKIGFVQGTLGITTGWGGATMLLQRLNQVEAMEMLLSCKRYSADEARDIGFIHRVMYEADFSKGCCNWLSSFTKQSGGVLKAYKHRWCDQFDKEDIKRRMAKEIDECSTLWASDEHHEAVQRFLAK